MISALLLAGCATAPPLGPHRPDDDGFLADTSADAPAMIESGRRIVEIQCISCHAVRADGQSRNKQAPPLRTLAERYPVTGLEQAFAQGIMVGHPGMPDFHFNQSQIKSILAYLNSIQTRQGAERAPDASAARFAYCRLCRLPG
ncbi:MAG: cytochrome c [Hyphomonadaceae bacterium]